MDEHYKSKIIELINKSEITSVVNGYFRALDERTFDAQHFATIFTTEATVTRPNGSSLTGPRDISTSHQHSFARFESSQHLLTGHEISIEGKTAIVRVNLMAMHMWQGSNTNANRVNNFFIAGGVVDAKLVHANGQWRISQVSNTVLWRAGGFKNMAQTDNLTS